MKRYRLVYPRRWSRRLEDIHERIAIDNPRAAASMIRRIRTAVERLQEFPALGRPGRVEGTRELVVAGSSYIVPYRIRGDTVEIIAILHTAQRWPEHFPNR